MTRAELACAGLLLISITAGTVSDAPVARLHLFLGGYRVLAAHRKEERKEEPWQVAASLFSNRGPEAHPVRLGCSESADKCRNLIAA